MLVDRGREVAEVRAMMEAAARGDLKMAVYGSREEAYADLGLGGEGD